MNKGLLIFLGIAGALLLWVWSSYNGLVTKDEEVKKWFAKIQTQYQRRADVFKNAVETVKGAAQNEKDILLGVTKARAGIDEAKAGMEKATTPADLEKYYKQAEQAAMNFKIQIEAYPNIRSTEAFIKFQDEITGTENQVAVARNDYNTAVQDFNTHVRKFPMNLLSGIFGMSAKPSFEAEKGTEKAPDVKF